MKKYYRRRIITSAMIAFVILMTVVIGGIYLFSYLQMEQNTDRAVQALLSQQEGEKRIRREVSLPSFLGYTPGKRMIPSAYYEIGTDPYGQIRYQDLHGYQEEENDILSYAETIQKTGKERGKLGPYKYAIKTNEDGSCRLILMNVSIQLQTLYGVMISALIIGLGLSVLLLIILFPISSKAADMIIRGTEKQKQFITDAGHELKTPVAVIRSNLDVMELLDGPDKWSGNIRRQVDRLEGLIKQLLLLARLDEKQWTGKTDNIDFSRMLQDETDTYREEAENRNQKLEIRISESLHIRGDQEALRQMLHAILDNAIQYTPGGGMIQIGLKKEKKQLLLQLTNTVDTLPSTSPEQLTDRFTRGDTARSRKTGGTGIGLSAARSVAELCHGSITVSYPGEKRFQVEIRLPASEKHP